jgi:hypothetical protein
MQANYCSNHAGPIEMHQHQHTVYQDATNSNSRQAQTCETARQRISVRAAKQFQHKKPAPHIDSRWMVCSASVSFPSCHRRSTNLNLQHKKPRTSMRMAAVPVHALLFCWTIGLLQTLVVYSEQPYRFITTCNHTHPWCTTHIPATHAAQTCSSLTKHKHLTPTVGYNTSSTKPHTPHSRYTIPLTMPIQRCPATPIYPSTEQCPVNSVVVHSC